LGDGGEFLGSTEGRFGLGEEGIVR
jgi:hypothetical protein